MQVLVVERGRDSAESIAAWLEGDGYTCAVATDARQAIRMARLTPPDTAIVDLAIARDSGPHLAARLRSLSPDVRIVVLSASGEFDPDLVARLRVCDWLVTPVARGELLRAIERPRRAARGLGPEEVEAFHALLRRRNRGLADAAVRVQHWARLVGEDLGLSARHVNDIGHAALLGEVGRLGLPPALDGLDAPQSLTERALFETHPEIAHALLSSVNGLAPVASLVRCAHERFDGTGYPAACAARRFQSAPASWPSPTPTRR